MKKVWLLIVALVLSTILAACGGNTQSTDKASEGQAPKDKKLVVYTNSVSEGRGDWLKQKAAEAGFKIEIVEAGGGDLLNRLVAEKNKPLADVVYGLNQMNFETLKTNDLLVPFEPTWKNEIPAGSSEKENFYHPLVEQRIIMIYNQDVYTKETAPKDWTDLIENQRV